MDILNVRSSMEDLRHKGFLNKVLEAEFKEIEKSKREGAIKTIEGALNEQLGTKDGEVKAGLVKSIQKLLTFSEKGGTVDFVAPEDRDDAEGEAPDSAELRAALIEVRDVIRDYQSHLHGLKLLSDGTMPSPPG